MVPTHQGDSMRRSWIGCALMIGTVVVPGRSTLVAQDGASKPMVMWTPLSGVGVLRASAQVDSVFIDRLVRETTVEGGDWVSYLAVRLGVDTLPEPSGIRVAVDSARIFVDGRLMDLPAETRALFGPIAMMLDSTTALRAEIVLGNSGPGLVRFILRRMMVNGFPIPESLLGPFLARVGKQYPVLTSTGRELRVQIPEDGAVLLRPIGVVLQRAVADAALSTDSTTRVSATRPH